MSPSETEEESVRASSLGSVSVWLRELPQATKDAQEEMFRRYSPHLARYAAFRLRQLGVRGTDADDIVQEVFMGLFRRIVAGQMRDLKHRDQLWLKLQRICSDRVKDARRKRSLATESALGADDDGALIGLAAIPDRELDECLLVVEHAMLRDHLSRRHRDLPDVARMRIEGLSVQEIADRMGAPKRTIERRLEWIDEICDAYSNQ